MTRRRNFLPLVGLLVCLFALLSYPSFFARFPGTRDVPWVNWLLFACGFALLGIGLVRAFGRPERHGGQIAAPILVALGVVLGGFFVYLTEVASRQLPASASAPKVGEKAPDFTLPDVHLQPVRLSGLVGTPSASWVLLIFYRGYW